MCVVDWNENAGSFECAYDDDDDNDGDTLSVNERNYFGFYGYTICLWRASPKTVCVRLCVVGRVHIPSCSHCAHCVYAAL